MSWVEARLKLGREPREVYDWLPEPPDCSHHFWNEPWWPGAYVIRLDGTVSNLRECPAISHLALWDERPDQQLYGRYWPYVAEFFERSSIISVGLLDDERMNAKLVHCFLNARGMDPRQEAWFAIKFAWRRLTIGLRWRLYLRRQYERQAR